jgi:uncharacterized membrane protein (UPF0127 family)
MASDTKMVRIKLSILIPAAILLVLLVAIIILSQPGDKGRISLDSFFTTGNITLENNNASSIFSVYLAETIPQQLQGYMNQSSIGDCGNRKDCIGMLFLFGNVSQQCFWMANTEIPLEQSWIAQNGIVTYAYEAQAYSTKNVCANGTMVLETLPGRIAIGDTVKLNS